MIIWIASYPKSGNTWVRALLSYYFFSTQEKFNFDILKHIPNFNVGDFVNSKTHFESNLNFADKALDIQKFICKKSKVNLFFKTHSCLNKISEQYFTDNSVSLGCIYVVRDPRNIITSYKNFENWSYEKTLNFMKHKESFLYSNEKTQKKLGIKGMEIISSWSNNYNSWVKNNKNIPICLIKYEDLMNNTLKELEKMFDFIIKINNEKNIAFDLERGKRSVEQTNFKKLQELEKKDGFEENKEHKENKKFFNQGKLNDWCVNLPEHVKETLNNNFKNEMLELGYLK